MIPNGTPLAGIVNKGEFKPMSPMEILKELRILVKHTDLTECVFRTNHASNYLPIGGTLRRDKKKILTLLDDTIENADESQLRPGYLRGL
jgi:hypothetical protein